MRGVSIPRRARHAARRYLKRPASAELPIGMVTGDDVLDRIAAMDRTRASTYHISKRASRSRALPGGW